MEYREIVNVATSDLMQHEINGVLLTPQILRELKRKAFSPSFTLPPDFDDAVYLSLHPDVAAAGAHPREHYLQYGYREGRQYKPPQPSPLTSGAKPKILSTLMRALKKSPRF